MKTKTFFLSDLKSGLFIFLIALPLCLGIALASGFPPIAGVFTAIVGGTVSSLLGSSRLTIKGPAAGLIVIAIAAVQELGQGDAHMGYRRALAAGAVAAIVQMGLSLVKAGKLGAVIPPSIVHGMLAAIGVIIFAKQFHVMLGVVPHSTSPLGALAEIPQSVWNEDPFVSILGFITILGLVIFPRIKGLKKIPAVLLNLLIVVPIGLYWHLDVQHRASFLGTFYDLGPKLLVNIPNHALASITHPDWSVLLTGAGWKFVMMFALVGTIESILTVTAVDAIDPERRSSDLDRDLFSVGAGNLLCALIGGLPMISEIVRSKANIDNHAKGISSNIFHGIFLLLTVTLFPGWIDKIPLSALAAMLVVTGYRLASPKEFLKVRRQGLDQTLLFGTTLILTLLTDLLVGVTAGIILNIVMHLIRGVKPSQLFMLDIALEKTAGGAILLKPKGPCVFLNLARLQSAINLVLATAEEVTVDFSSAGFVDFTTSEKLRVLADTSGKGRLHLEGLPHGKGEPLSELATN